MDAKPTPSTVLSASYLIAAFLEEAGYVSVLIGKNGGAIYYRDCPLSSQQNLLTELAELSERVAFLQKRIDTLTKGAR